MGENAEENNDEETTEDDPEPIETTDEDTSSAEGGPWAKKVVIKICLARIYCLTNAANRPAGDIKSNAQIIQDTLHEFGIDVDMGEIRVYPSVTQYSLKPNKGVKLSRITTLSNDLALALAAHPIRIEAPIPGKSLVGIEVPESKTALVSFKELFGKQRILGSSAQPYDWAWQRRGWKSLGGQTSPHATPPYRWRDRIWQNRVMNTIIMSLLFQKYGRDASFYHGRPQAC